MKLVYWAAHRQVGRRHDDGKLSHQTHIGFQFVYEVAFNFLQKVILNEKFPTLMIYKQQNLSCTHTIPVSSSESISS